MKPISSNLTNISEKKFNLKISDAKVFERSTRLLRQSKENIVNDGHRSVKHNNVDLSNANRISLGLADIANMNETSDQEKNDNIKNPFEWFEDNIHKKLAIEFKEDIAKIKIENKFIYDLFKNVELLSLECLSVVMQDMTKMVDDKYNWLSIQVNEFVTFFILIFDAYVSLEIADPKFEVLHNSLILFFAKSLKNVTEEMMFIFKNVFIANIFTAISQTECREKLHYFCDLIFRILQPTDVQQVDFFKIFKDNIVSEDILYEAFSVLHDLFFSYTEGLMDICLFYILNGITSVTSDIRYHSLYILHKYIQINVNFFFNLQDKIEKISRSESDKENNLLIIKMALQYLKYLYHNKSKAKEVIMSKKNVYIDNRMDEETLQQNYQDDLALANKIINNVLYRYRGDSLFTLLACNAMSEHLYDNMDLVSTFLYCLFSCDENVQKFILYNEPLEDRVNILHRYTRFRHKPELTRHDNWNNHILFKAYNDLLLKNSNMKALTERDYNFIKFIIAGGFTIVHTELWKNNFQFSRFVVQDMNNSEKCARSLEIMEAFLFFEPIHKHILEENYDQLQSLFREVEEDHSENGEKCKEMIKMTLTGWIQNQYSSSILRDGLRKLLENFK